MNPPEAYITTSWDDGHPLDLRVAELLAKYSLPGTFYIPGSWGRQVLAPARIRELSANFDIGAHTMGHIDLCQATPEQARREIVDSKRYIEDLTGSPCVVFAPPLGSFRAAHLAMIERAGFRGVRTVELMNAGSPRTTGGLVILPTSLQVYPHGGVAYIHNAIKRLRLRNLLTYLTDARGASLPSAAETLFTRVTLHGGVFHLWGHSWEIDEHGLWGALESILRRLHENIGAAKAVSNTELCAHTRALSLMP
jgi:peptidoglycan-N-acetylglucosamine deacetylase